MEVKSFANAKPQRRKHDDPGALLGSLSEATLHTTSAFT
jgi:hypothetical protein